MNNLWCQVQGTVGGGHYHVIVLICHSAHALKACFVYVLHVQYLIFMHFFLYV